ncbi:MAG: PAS domain-containing protein, partial [Prochloraceae cyanobacterium]
MSNLRQYNNGANNQRISGSSIENTERKQLEALLKQAHQELELRVEERTAELKQANKRLQSEILQRQRTEEALRSSMATNRALLNAIPDWMFRLSKDGTFVNFKAAKSNNLPLPTRDFLGKKLDEVFPKEIAQAMMNGVTLALSNNEMQIFEYQLTLNNELLYYEARIAVSAEDEVMAIIRDISQRKRSEEDIRQALAKEKEL